MVVKLIGWPAWPSLSSKKFEAILVVHRLEGLTLTQSESGKALVCELKWNGQKGALSSLSSSAKRNFTEEVLEMMGCWNGTRGFEVCVVSRATKRVCLVHGRSHLQCLVV